MILKPIYDHDRYSAPIARAIFAVLFAEIFKPLFEILNIPEGRANAPTTKLAAALRGGRLQYVDGFFIGPLNAGISKELRGLGARYNKTRKAYTLERSALPQDIVIAISEGNILAKDQLNKVQDFLYAIEGRKLKMPDLEPYFVDTLAGLSKQFQSTTKKITAREFEIPLDPRLADELKEAYTINLEKYIQNWQDEQILRLRQKVARNVEKGFRSENLVFDIISERGVSLRKAQFLARQETSLMVSKYREIRYEDIGVRRYMWSTSRDSRVRHDHRELQGEIFRFDQPPVTDQATMARNNPGEDYNCRCVAIPVLSTVNMLEREYAGK